MLRPGNAGSNTATDYIEAARLALVQLPPPAVGRAVLVRADSGGGSHEFLKWLTAWVPAAALLRRDNDHRSHRRCDREGPRRRVDAAP